jgi:pimeloyl-ACP methyl ester carboxylesterase
MMKTFKKLLLALTTTVVATFAQADCLVSKVSGEGQAVLLMPGFISDETVWDEVASKLSQQFEVHQLAIAGFGKNPACEQSSDIYLQTVKEVKQYINQSTLKDPVFVGHSMGGLMAFQLGVEKTNKLSAVISVDGLPFIGPIFTGTNDTQLSDLSYQATAIKNLYENASQENIRMMTKQGAGIQTGDNKRIESLLSMAGQSDPKTAGSAIYSVMTTDLRPKMKNIDIPVLLIGAAGGYTETAQQQAAKRLYETQLSSAQQYDVIMNNEGRHFLMWDQQDWLVNTLTQFIKERS